MIDGRSGTAAPREALTPGETFLAAVAACGIEVVEVIATDDGLEVGNGEVQTHGVVDRERPVSDEVTVFNRVRMGSRSGV